MMHYIVKPIPGEIVMYQTDGRNYDYALPAMVSVTEENLVAEAVAAGQIEALSSELHVHLLVFGPGGLYVERDVPPAPTFGVRRTWFRREPVSGTAIPADFDSASLALREVGA